MGRQGQADEPLARADVVVVVVVIVAAVVIVLVPVRVVSVVVFSGGGSGVLGIAVAFLPFKFDGRDHPIHQLQGY